MATQVDRHNIAYIFNGQFKKAYIFDASSYQRRVDRKNSKPLQLNSKQSWNVSTRKYASHKKMYRKEYRAPISKICSGKQDEVNQFLTFLHLKWFSNCDAAVVCVGQSF